MIDKWLDANFEKLVGIRRWIHQHPEVGFNEHETARYCQNLMSELGLEICKNEEMKTGFYCDYGNGVTTDSSGNIYVTGKTGGGLDGNTSSGGYDIFLVKYNSSGTKQWTKQLGTSSSDSGNGVTTDSSGNIYVTGYTNGGLDGNTNSGSYDIFIVKYNSSGIKQ